MPALPIDTIREQCLRAERWVGRRFFATPFLDGDRRVLFVLGHMRTGSSLLVHILASHRNVVGYGETHNVYTRTADFGAAAANVYRSLRRLPGNEAYLLDKVLHKYQITRTEVLRHPSVRVIFMIRRPDTALSSMVCNEVVAGAEDAYQHYVQQVEWVCRLSQNLSADQWTSTTYSELTQKSHSVLHRIESFLELSTPLSERYDTNRHTGTRGVGDSGPHIEAGHIKRNIDRDVDLRVRPYVKHARQQFKTCLQLLQEKGRLNVDRSMFSEKGAYE